MVGKMVSGQAYTVSAWVRISTASDTVKISFEIQDGLSTRYENVSGASGTANSTGWIFLTGSYTPNITPPLYVLDVYFEGPATGTDIYVDDANVFGPEVAPPSPNATGTVNTSVRHQVLDGFGASGAWYEGDVITYGNSHPDIYNILFRDLGLDIYRIRNAYNVDTDNGTTYMTRTAQIIATGETSLGHPLRVMNTSWSPPAYLKSNGNTRQGTLAKDGGGNYRYADFAQWWRDSLTAWSNAGVNSYYLNMQNEPGYQNPLWDTCQFNPTQDTSYAGYEPAFAALCANLNSLPSRPILLAPEGQDTTSTPSYVSALTAADKSNVYGYSHHLYDGDANNPDGFISKMTTLKAAIGGDNKPLLQTEYSRGYLTDPWANAMNLAKLMHNSLTVEEVSAYLYWQLFWPSPDGLVSVSSSSSTINPIYYAFKHYSAFTDPNWQRVDASTDSSNLRISAYISPDNTQLSVVIINAAASTDMNLTLSFPGFSITDSDVYRSTSTQNCVLVGGLTYPLSLPANSITTVALFAGEVDTTPPAPPMNLSATPGPGVVTLDWNDNNESDLAGYNIYRSTTSGSGYTRQNTSLLAGSSFADYNVVGGTPYYYVVTAVDTSLNESNNSSQVSATPENAINVHILGSWVAGLTHAKEAGDDRALIFIVHTEQKNSVVSLNSVTYGGQTMTKIIDQYNAGSNDRVYVAAFILNDANIVAADETGTFVPNWTGTPMSVAYSSVFFGTVDQTTSVGASASGTGSSNNNPTTTTALATNRNDMVIEAAVGSSAGSFTLNNNFNLGITHYSMVSSDGIDGNKPATGVAETPSVTHIGSARKAIVGFVLKVGAAPLPNVPPTVSITAPANSSLFAKDANITIDTDAADSDGSVTKVEFFQGTTKLGENTIAPFSYNWNYAPTGLYTLTAKATDNDGNSTVSLPVNITVLGAPGTGAVLSEWWTGIPGTAVSDLTSDVNYPDNSSGKELILKLQGPTNWADDYGTRIRGYLNPVTTGDYTFSIAADDSAELWLSTNDNPANIAMIANTPGPQSSPIALVAGQKFYIEVLHKESTGNDNISVSWQGPAFNEQVIDGIYLSPCCLEFRIFAGFANQWNQAGCNSGNDWCDAFDFNRDGSVLLDDLRAFADAWLAGM
jgi:glucuronoarabinoxylan endo-1,4-beta-xylanase